MCRAHSHLHPILLGSNGKGGYHCYFWFATPQPICSVHHWLQSLVVDWETYGLASKPETYPKSPGPLAVDAFGGWLRVPGLHHTYNYYSTAYDYNNYRWLTLKETVQLLIHHGSCAIPDAALVSPPTKSSNTINAAGINTHKPKSNTPSATAHPCGPNLVQEPHYQPDTHSQSCTRRTGISPRTHHHKSRGRKVQPNRTTYTPIRGMGQDHDHIINYIRAATALGYYRNVGNSLLGYRT